MRERKMGIFDSWVCPNIKCMRKQSIGKGKSCPICGTLAQKFTPSELVNLFNKKDLYQRDPQLLQKEEQPVQVVLRPAITTKNWIAYSLMFMGFCMVFGGIVTFLTTFGTLAQSITTQVTANYVLIGFVLMFIGFAILLVKTEE
jgi:hypothetical protein